MELVEPKVEVLYLMPDPEKVIDEAASQCYQRELKTDEQRSSFVQDLMKRGHESVFEHVVARFKITCDRGTATEFVRHRIGISPTQESTRLCAYKGDIKVIMPDFGFDGPKLDACEIIAMKAYQDAEKHYHNLLAAGAAPQHARSVLPIGIKTSMVVTGNARAWHDVIRKRVIPAAHPHIRHIMRRVQSELSEWFPSCFNPDGKDTNHG